MKTLMVDMDDVITDGMFLQYINEFMKTDYKLDDISDYYYVQKLIGDRYDFWDYISDKNFYQDAPLLDGCYEALEKLNKIYDIYIVTAYLWTESRDISGNNLRNKYNYLREMLPFIGPEKYIFASNKRIINFDIRIDDRMSNLEGATTKLLFTAWHNKDITDLELAKNNVIRVNNWKEIIDILVDE